MRTKLERPEEKFACETIVKYSQLTLEGIAYEPNGVSTAPDYVLYVKRAEKVIKVNLEIRTVWGVEITPDGHRIREKPAIDPFQGFNKSLQLKARDWIKKGERFIVNCCSRLPSKETSKILLHKWIKPLNKEIKRLDAENKIPIRHVVPAIDNLEDSILRYTQPINPYYFSMDFRG